MLRGPLEPGQYTAIRYTERLEEIGAMRSIGSRGDGYDNALAEAVNGLYKAEVIHRQGASWRSLERVELATAEWVNWWNQERIQERGVAGQVATEESRDKWAEVAVSEAVGQMAEAAECSKQRVDAWISETQRRDALAGRRERWQLQPFEE